MLVWGLIIMNKKGITIIELLVSISIIAIIIILLLRVMISLNNINNNGTYASSDEISRTTIIKNIENDFLKYSLKGLKVNKKDDKTEITLSFDTKYDQVLIIEDDKLTYKDTYNLESNKAKYNLCPKINYLDLDDNYYLITIEIEVLIDNEAKQEKDDIYLSYVGLKKESNNYEIENYC